LSDALLQEEAGVPCAISPFVVDSPHLFVEDGDEGEDFGKGICDDFEVQFTGDTADLVGEVKEDSPWEGRMSVDWGREIYFSTCNCIVLMMRFVPFGVTMS
jgi:hypothetical protein